MEGKIVVITGGNSGIGKETARELSRRGARVTILCRSEAKALEAIEDIGASVEYRNLDLSSLASVKNCAQGLLKDNEYIDVLINNAGIFFIEKQLSSDGYELQFATNHLGHFYLTQKLLPLLRKSAEKGRHPRIVILSSSLHSKGLILFDDINFENRTYDRLTAYAQSKLANILHAKELAKRLLDTGINVYSVHPGIVDTNLLKSFDNFCILRLLRPLVSWMLKTPKEGAETVIFCSTEEALNCESGKYYANLREVIPHHRALNEEDQKRLWELSLDMIEKKIGA